MEPSVSLHHFVHPSWFDDLGGWGKEENVHLFVKFAEWSFQQFGTRAKLWATFNEPSVRRLIPAWQRCAARSTLHAWGAERCSTPAWQPAAADATLHTSPPLQ